MSRKSRNIRKLPENFDFLNHSDFEVKSAQSSEDSLENLLSDLRDLSTGSSTLSWGGDCQNEASKQIQTELELMDQVLRGEAPIPPHYDSEEYQEWIDFFPNLCVLGHRDPPHRSTTPVNNTEDSVPELAKKIIKKSNSDQIIYNEILNVKKEPLIRRQQSSRSLISSHFSSSKWLKDDEGDYNPLPFLVGNFHVRNHVDRHHVPLKGILKNTKVLLPPIEKNCFRSVSATPRRGGKTFSAQSVGRLQKEAPNFLGVNGVAQRKGRGKVDRLLK